jgi:1-acyl-sn-glycerol-3-phosphate acyltransferase
MMSAPLYSIFLFARSLLLYGGFAIVLVVHSSIASLMALLLPHQYCYRFCFLWCDFATAWARLTCGIRHEIIGRENIPDGAAVVLSKHQSAWETLFLQSLFYPACIVLKHDLMRVPFLSWGLRQMDPIVIDRSRPAAAMWTVLEQGSERLRAGRRVIVFPEGTRTRPGAEPEYSVGGAMLATRTGAIVIPVALNSGECWPRGTFVKRPGIIKVVIGPPLRSSDYSTKQLNQIVRDWIEGQMRLISPHDDPATIQSDDN